MHISPYFWLYLLTNRLLLLQGLLVLVLLVLPGRLPMYNSPPPPHETSSGSTSIAEEFRMIEVPCPTRNCEEIGKRVGASGLWVCELQTYRQGRQV